MSFSNIYQKLWPTSRPKSIKRQHFNLTQIPFDVEVNINIQLALDYQILLHFEKPIEPLNTKQAIAKVLLFFQEMKIEIGDSVAEFVAISCHSPQNSKI